MPPFAERLLEALAERGALLSGHFRLSSGRHSDRFVQKFRMLEDPVLVEMLAVELVARVRAELATQGADPPTIVVSAAVGGIILGYETARQLGVKAIFVEKEAGAATLRRGFALEPADRVLVVEDVVTTGGSVREVLDVVAATGATTIAVGAVVRRQPVDFGVGTTVLLELPVASYTPEACPQCARGEALIEPGSRFLARPR